MYSVNGLSIIVLVISIVNDVTSEAIVKRSLECSNNGVLINGVCICETGAYGDNCECLGNKIEHEAMCKAPNSTIMCSGRGDCLCGMCSCRPRRSNSQQIYSGKFCQCDDYSCPYYNNALCGGPDRGMCQCSDCVCKEGYAGPMCECSTSTQNCIASDGSICNGVGSCECNYQCVCNGGYAGPTCEDCKDCPSMCVRLKSCVQCIAFGIGTCSANCFEKDIRVVDTLTEGYNLCEFKDEDDCIYKFTYNYKNGYRNEPEILASSIAECPPPKGFQGNTGMSNGGNSHSNWFFN